MDIGLLAGWTWRWTAARLRSRMAPAIVHEPSCHGGAGFIGSNLIEHIIDRPGIGRLVNPDCPDVRGTCRQSPRSRDITICVRSGRPPRSRIGGPRRGRARHHPRAASGVGVPRGSLHSWSGEFGLPHCRNLQSVGVLPYRLDGHFRGAEISSGEHRWVYGSLGPTGYFTEETPYAPNSLGDQGWQT